MSAPVRHTCPDIDKVINGIQQAINNADKGKDICEKKSDEWLYFEEIIDSLYRMTDILEELRTSNGSLRDWGHELEKEVSEAQNNEANIQHELENAKSQIQNLECDNMDLKREIKSIEDILNKQTY